MVDSSKPDGRSERVEKHSSASAPAVEAAFAPMPTPTKLTPKKNISVDIKSHHAQCELNFHRMLTLMPKWDEGARDWSFALGAGGLFVVQLTVLDAAPYTTTVEVVQRQQGLQPPRLVVRLYHDANMAEIVSWDRHRNWRPQYEYPNPQMYHADEKLELNRFLGEWLEFCHKQGYAQPYNCEVVRVTKK
ncbi:DUF1249 domain-containing protein [Teredinibacter waterburyi]|jgi:Uncharacterized protein conserved in bacteria|uniref:DUF1249 domain-containing protein n=1 Tax=Teredinibacter waterburyi TaxID=1500538 RepID=UPI001FE76127|nr:DUF1249 domain-containing protein [Teredinibacter waterburyi]